MAGAWLCAFPCLSRFTALRLKHFDHHRKVGTLADPDRYYWGWESNDRKEFLRHHLMSASGLWFFRHLLGRFAGVATPLPPVDPKGRPREVGIPFGPEDGKEFAGVVVWHLGALAAFTITIGWIWYFLLWLLPLLTLRSLINDLRQFLEHRHGRLLVYNTHPVERFFFGPFNFHLHGYHHAFPQEPWFLLPSLGERARRKCPDILDYDSYLGELVAFLAGRDRQGPTADLPTAPRGDASTLPASG
jgi:fatty acid desaturase